MGLRPVLGRLLNAADDGPKAAGVAVLTHRFWTTVLDSDPAVVGKTIRLGPGTATVVGVLEPSVPYPAETQIIANVVTSPHHLGATMVTDRTHRMTELFGRLAPGATLEAARAELDQRARVDDGRASRGVLRAGSGPTAGHDAPRADRIARTDDPAPAPGGGGGRLRHRVLERRQPDPGPVGPPRSGACPARRAGCGPGRAPTHPARREPGPLCRRRRARPDAGRAAGDRGGPLCRALLRSRARSHGGRRACSGSGRGWPWWRPCCSPTFHGSRPPIGRAVWGWLAAACG